jgi:ABC-type Na+ transport system ATPase subunit NatA
MGEKWKMREEVNSMITPTIGEIFKNSLTGKVYEVTRILDEIIILHSLNGLNQVLTEKENLNLFYEKVRNLGGNSGRKEDR